MIKINLALKKKAAFVASQTQTKIGTGSLQLSKLKIDWEGLKEYKLHRLVLATLALYLGYTGYEEYKSGILSQLDSQIATLSGQRANLQRKADQMKNYAEDKKRLEEDEKMLTTKIDVIGKLIATRSGATDLMLLLTDSIPTDVWLSKFQLTSKDLTFEGRSKDYDLVSSFMRKLTESTFLTNVKLKETLQENFKEGEISGLDIARFGFTAERRKE